MGSKTKLPAQFFQIIIFARKTRLCCADYYFSYVSHLKNSKTTQIYNMRPWCGRPRLKLLEKIRNNALPVGDYGRGITVTYIELKNYINRDSRVESLSSC